MKILVLFFAISQLSLCRAQTIYKCGVDSGVLPQSSAGVDCSCQGPVVTEEGGGQRPLMCTKHFLTRVVRPVVDEIVREVPVVRKRIAQREELVTRRVPVLQKIVSRQEEKYIHHEPVVRKFVHPVTETRTRQVPVVKKRVKEVVETYTQHVPVSENVTRSVVDTLVEHVPVVENRVRPVVHQFITDVQVTEKRTKPVVEQYLTHVPVKQRFLRNLVEQRVVARRVPYVSTLPNYAPPLCPQPARPYGYSAPAYGYAPGTYGYSPPACGYAPRPYGYPAPAYGYAPGTYGYLPPACGYATRPYGYSAPAYGYAAGTYGYLPPACGYANRAYGYSAPAIGYATPYGYAASYGRAAPSVTPLVSVPVPLGGRVLRAPAGCPLSPVDPSVYPGHSFRCPYATALASAFPVPSYCCAKPACVGVAPPCGKVLSTVPQGRSVEGLYPAWRGVPLNGPQPCVSVYPCPRAGRIEFTRTLRRPTELPGQGMYPSLGCPAFQAPTAPSQFSVSPSSSQGYQKEQDRSTTSTRPSTATK